MIYTQTFKYSASYLQTEINDYTENRGNINGALFKRRWELPGIALVGRGTGGLNMRAPVAREITPCINRLCHLPTAPLLPQ